MVPQFYDISNSERSEEEVGALRQVCLGFEFADVCALGMTAWEL